MKKLLIVLLCLIILSQISASVSADPTSLPLIVSATSEGVVFYQLDTRHQLQKVGELPSTFGVENYGGKTDWLALTWDSFAASPDGTKIAFTAKNKTGSALFVYTISSGQLIQKTISSYWLLPKWSPDGTAILLKTGYSYTGPNPIPEDKLIYDLSSDQLTLVFSGGISLIGWLPDSSGLIYLGNDNLYVINRDGSNRHLLADLATQVAPDGSNNPLSVCGLTWSPFDQRWYLVVGCYWPDPGRDRIYSIDASGHNSRLETNHLVIDEGDFVNLEVLAMQASATNLYVLQKTDSRWIMLRFDGSGTSKVVYNSSISSDDRGDINDVGLSPDRQRFYVVIFNVAIHVMSLKDSTFSTQIQSPHKMRCDARWLDNAILAYDITGGGLCGDTSSTFPQQVALLDTNTGVETSVTGSLDGSAWLIPTTEAAD